MTVEIREVWLNDVKYTVDEANVLFAELRQILSRNPVCDKSGPNEHLSNPVQKEMIPIGLRPMGTLKGDFQKIGPEEEHPDPDDKHCSTCGSEGHNKQTCPVVDKAVDYRCTLCGLPGHNRRTCPQAEYIRQGFDTPTRAFPRSGPGRVMHCSVCQKAGHNKRTCPVKKEQVEALVNNFSGWNAYMKNTDNHIYFKRGKHRGHLNLKRMGEEYRLLKYGSILKRR